MPYFWCPMKLPQVKKLNPLQRLMYLITEREAIRLKKEAGDPKPWTDDEILLSYRFCNVRRMDDKVSRWLMENWYTPNYGHCLMLPAVALARFVNRPDSLHAVGFPSNWNVARIESRLRQCRDTRGKVFNGAYMVRGNDGKDKIASVVSYCTPLVTCPPILNTSSMEECWTEIKTYYGFGSFMAGQVVADLRHAMSGLWSDKLTWAPIGPGSRRGMNRLHKREPRSPLSQAQFGEELTAMMCKCRDSLPKSITGRLEAHDYQNCLCESDKYNRVLLGEGRPKQLYDGRSR